MDTKELIERYCEETGCLENDTIMAVIVYGSRTTDHYSASSDLDVFAITTDSNSYTKSIMIDGVSTETFYLSLDDLYANILYAHSGNNRYYVSVFYTGIIVKNEREIVEIFKNHLDELETIHKPNRKISFIIGKRIQELSDLYDKADINEKSYYYYNLLEIIRKTYHFIKGYSTLNIAKFYDIYKEPNSYGTNYKLNLPPLSFRELFLKAVHDLDNKDSNLEALFKVLNYNIDDFKYLDMPEDESYYDVSRIKSLLISINKRICKLEEMLIYNHAATDYCYFVLLDGIKRFYIEIGYDTLEFKELFEMAISEKDANNRIDLLEKIFAIVNKKIDFDYDDYSLRRF